MNAKLSCECSHCHTRKKITISQRRANNFAFHFILYASLNRCTFRLFFDVLFSTAIRSLWQRIPHFNYFNNSFSSISSRIFMLNLLSIFPLSFQLNFQINTNVTNCNIISLKIYCIQKVHCCHSRNRNFPIHCSQSTNITKRGCANEFEISRKKNEHIFYCVCTISINFVARFYKRNKWQTKLFRFHRKKNCNKIILKWRNRENRTDECNFRLFMATCKFLFLSRALFLFHSPYADSNKLLRLWIANSSHKKK